MTNARGRLYLGVALTIALAAWPSHSARAADWSMFLSPQSVNAISGQTIHFDITFTNNLPESLFFSSFGDGQSLTVNLKGNVIGAGACGPLVDCFVQNLFLTSADPIEIPADSPGMTFDLGDLLLGAHQPDDEIVVVAKGGPDSLTSSAFPDPAFAETAASVLVSRVAEPGAGHLLTIGLIVLCLAKRSGRRGRRDGHAAMHARQEGSIRPTP
jgi:hypothetical protein